MLKRLTPYIILTLGISLAGAFGSRNGEQHTAYRMAEQVVSETTSHSEALAQGVALLKDRETLPQAAADALEEAAGASWSGETQAKVTAASVILEEDDGGEGGVPVDTVRPILQSASLSADFAKDAAKEVRDDLGLPQPRERLMQWLSVGGIPWLGGIGLIILGAVLARRQIAADQVGGGAAGNVADFPGTVQHALSVIDEIETLIADLPMDDDGPEARAKIDALVDSHLGPLVDARGQLIARHGLAGFAMYFGPFSGGERNLARTWSALTDGHAAEARESLVSARREFADAMNNWPDSA